MIKRIIITGGPCSGKTSIIDSLKDEGYKCFNEISREVIQKMNIKTSTQIECGNCRRSESSLWGRKQDSARTG